ncbi:hypothetical protein ACFWGY_05420 [Prauserella salsuginis]|uniref:FAD/NAD(P)-binding domain-containing protein n=1 Tax=Prauserella salsuginis TaxID=387889 RepID=A0ABW6G0P0_9PSEU
MTDGRRSGAQPDSRYERIVVVGASRAGAEAVGQLRAQGFAGEVTVVDAARLDPTPAGANELSGVRRFGVTAVGLDTGKRGVRLATSEKLACDGLIVATGCRMPTPCLRLVPLGRAVGAGLPPTRRRAGRRSPGRWPC